MHEKWARDGLVILAVTLEEGAETPEDHAAARASVEKFLAQSRPPFRNLTLQVDPKELPPNLTFSDSVPRVFVFNRENRFVLRLPVVNDKREEVEPVDYDAIEKAVAEVMKKP